MATANLNIRTEKAIRDQAEKIFNELGLDFIQSYSKNRIRKV